MPPQAKGFWEYVQKTATCWLWIGALDQSGYGVRTINGEAKATYRAHRLAYAELVGPIPAGLQLDHLCRVRNCVNPAHLEPVTSRENTMRGDTIPARNAVKTHCDNGHEFTPENTRLRSSGHRRCVACARAASLRYYHRNKPSARL